MKKVFLVMAIATLVATGVFAQAKGKEVKNYFSGEINILGAGVRYERMLTDKMSIGANAYWSTLIVWSEVEAGASFRFYFFPFFFAGTGLGFHVHTGPFDYEYKYSWSSTTYKASGWGDTYGIALSPEIGFKFDPGDKGGFFIQPGVKFPITFGWVSGSLYYYDTSNWISKGFNVGFGVIPYCGLGFCF